MSKKRIVVICPGRGTYTRETIKYLRDCNQDSASIIKWIDKEREIKNIPSLTNLDSMQFKSKTHMSGENASPLIYACSLKDFLNINQKKYDIVAITGNSMGWYTALTLAGVFTYKTGYNIIQTMGSMMKDKIIGGQIIYPIVDDEWQIDNDIKDKVLSAIQSEDAYTSIILGGYIVIGAEQRVLDKLLKILPKIDQYPQQLPYHGAFHTPLLESISTKAFNSIPESHFNKPAIPLIDGLGNIWSPFSSNISDLYQYTLGTQVTSTYNFTKAISVAIKEFCPDNLVLLGPGNTLGGAVGQILIQNKWNGIDSKKTFSDKQLNDTYLISMGINDQRKMVS
mgnify:FL=1